MKFIFQNISKYLQFTSTLLYKKRIRFRFYSSWI